MAELHPQARALLTEARRLPPIYTQSCRGRSVSHASSVRRTGARADRPSDGHQIGDTDRPLNCRAYHPNPTETRPILLFIHGGGWVLNDLGMLFRCPLQHPGQLG